MNQGESKVLREFAPRWDRNIGTETGSIEPLSDHYLRSCDQLVVKDILIRHCADGIR